MRAFIALDLPEEWKDKLTSLAASLAKSGADVRWTKKENFHLTLKFLGEVPDEKLTRISGALQEFCKGQEKFGIRILALGAFPGTSKNPP